MRYRANLMFLFVIATVITRPTKVMDLPVKSPPSEQQIQELTKKLQGPIEGDSHGIGVCPILGPCDGSVPSEIGRWEVGPPEWSKPR